MTDTVWLSVAPQKSELTAWFDMETSEEAKSARLRNMLFHQGGGHLDPSVLPRRATEQKGHKAKRMAHLFTIKGLLCVSEKAAAVLRQFDLGSGGLYPLELFRSDGVTPIDGPFWALNFGQKKNALIVEASRELSGAPQHGYRPELTVKDEDLALTAEALEGIDVWGDEKLRSGFFVSPKLGAALHKAGLAKVFHLIRCRIT